MELGDSTNPVDLVPGSPRGLGELGEECRRYADCLGMAGRGLQRIRTDGWTGRAADAFWDRYHGEPKNWLVAADCFAVAATTLGAYADSLSWAQGEAGTAIDMWTSGNLVTAQAKVHQKALRQQSPRIGFEDPGEVVRHEARAILAEARRQLARAGDEAAAALAGATEPAPQKRGFWDEAADVAADVGAALANAGGYAINGLASFGNAILHHPEGVAAIVAGAAAATAGAGGEVGGLALDASGAGAVVGVPVNVASAALIAAGVTTAAAGAGVLFINAAGDDAVHPASTSNQGASANQYAPKEGFRGKTEFSQDEIEQFIFRHTDEGLAPGKRPTMEQIHEALQKGKAEPILGRNAEKWEYKGVTVIVNYDIPWRSSGWGPN